MYSAVISIIQTNEKKHKILLDIVLLKLGSSVIKVANFVNRLNYLCIRFKEKLTDSFDAFNVVHNRHRGNRPQKDSLSVEMPLCEWLRKAFKYAIKFPVNIFKSFKRLMILKFCRPTKL